MVSPMQKVSSMVSSKLGDTLNNIKNWGGLFYNAGEYDIVPGVDVTEKLQSLVTLANSEGRTTIVFPEAAEYIVTSIVNDGNIVYFGDGASFTGGYGKVINSLTDSLSITEQLADVAGQVLNPILDSTIYKITQNKDVKILWLGDSITFGSGAMVSELTYQNLVNSELERIYPHVNFTFVNHAVGSTNTQDLIDDWDTLVTPELPVDLIIVGHGTNDTGQTNEQITGSWNELKNRIDAIGCDVLPVLHNWNLLAPMPYGNTPDPVMDARRREIYELIKGLVVSYRWNYVDSQRAIDRWLSQNGLTWDTTLIKYDDIHPNDLGHRIMATEVLRVLTTGLKETWMLDDRYGGKNYYLNNRNRKTLGDINTAIAQEKGWGIYDLSCQEVSWGGEWWENDPGSFFKCAYLFGTRAVTGEEPYKGNNQPDWQVIPNTAEFIEIKVTNAKRVWTHLVGSSTADIDFKISIDGVLVETKTINNESLPFAIKYTASSDIFPTEKETLIRIERDMSTVIPGGEYIRFNDFVVEYHPNSLNTANGFQLNKNIVKTIKSPDDAIAAGVVSRFGWTPGSYGWAQADVNFPSVCEVDFDGKSVQLWFMTTPILNTYVMVYIDDQYIQTINNVQVGGNVFESYTFSASNAGKHQLKLIGLKGAQINLKGIAINADTLRSGVGNCGDTIPIQSGFNAEVQITPFKPQAVGDIAIRSDNVSPHLQRFFGDWIEGAPAVGYSQTLDDGAFAELVFYGTTVTIFYDTYASGSFLKVEIDGVEKEIIDTYSASTVANASKSYTVTGGGSHVIRLTKLKQTNPAVSGGSQIILRKYTQASVSTPAFQYVSKLSNSELVVTGTGLFFYRVIG